MNPQLFTQPLSDYNLDNLAEKDGLVETIPQLTLDLPDKYIVMNLNNTINESMDYYDDANQFNLKNKRLKNSQMLEGKHLQEHKLYRHQTPYIDNEMFVGVDAIVAYVCAQTPRAEVYPASKSPESRALATDLEAYLHAHSEKFELARKMESAVYNLMGKYVGFIKLRWDPLYGVNGEIVPEVVDPNHVIVDKNAKLGENPRFICHVLKDTVDGLVAKFPDKKQEIYQKYTIKRKGPKNTTAEVVYREVWFTYYDDSNKPHEAVAWYTLDLVLAKFKNPNWLYGDEGENFLDNPMKPFVPFNVWNDGSHWIDKTSAVEQAVAQQDILNKVGRQNVDNISTANGFKVLDAHAMRSEDAQNFTGDPNQLLIVKTKPGQTVRDVVTQLPPQIVSQEALNMVVDNRQVIHNILGTPSQFRGDDEDQTKTASEAQLIKNQASGRQDKIVRAIESSMDKYFRLLTQMITVWYSSKHYATVNGGDGNFDFIEMHKNKIESGMTVKVESGTTLPFDKARQESVAMNLVNAGLLSPYDVYKLLHMDNPQKLYDNFVKWKTSPQELAMDVDNDDTDRMAIVDFTELMAGKKVEQRDDVSQEYIEQMRKLMISDKFLLETKTSTQKAIIKFVQEAVNKLSIRTELDELSSTEPPTPEPLPAPVAATFPPAPPMPAGMPGQIAPAGLPPAPGALPPSPGMPPGIAPPMGGMPPPPPPPPASPIQSILSGTPPIAGGAPPPPPSVGPPQPQVNTANPMQLPPF